ncbi:hypothetical protein B0T21DRAFT_353554 [Apiosordaria backusii]|uniref:Uncharacterized protein n=1 Tax=Apiosordaria backusii TaxID=314023 RepID=A0AA39ZRZ6_9PEZI|nr:hypothetical protein B0T21DRAFT_353554 [Apiosordaria backusii]
MLCIVNSISLPSVNKLSKRIKLNFLSLGLRITLGFNNVGFKDLKRKLRIKLNIRYFYFIDYNNNNKETIEEVVYKVSKAKYYIKLLKEEILVCFLNIMAINLSILIKVRNNILYYILTICFKINLLYIILYILSFIIYNYKKIYRKYWISYKL